MQEGADHRALVETAFLGEGKRVDARQLAVVAFPDQLLDRVDDLVGARLPQGGKH